jgi:hypothetical protein
LNPLPPSPQDEKYFQVPLCALAYGRSAEERLNVIIAYCMIETGRTFLKRPGRKAFLANLPFRSGLPNGFNSQEELHLAVLYGADVIGIRIGSLAATLNTHAALCEFCRKFQERNGRDAIVRLKKSFVFDARDGKGITPRQLFVLAAIYSVIGRKRGPVRITKKTILRRALGYKNAETARIEQHYRKDKAKALTEWQLRSTLESLTARRFFCRRTVGRRQTYYSHRMADADFERAIVASVARRAASRQLQRHKNENVDRRIRDLRAKRGPEFK